MEKVENQNVNYSEFELLSKNIDLFDIVTHNQDERWLRNRWNVSDFKIIESRRLNFGPKRLVYYDIINKITKVTIEDVLSNPTDIEDCLKMHNWGKRP